MFKGVGIHTLVMKYMYLNKQDYEAFSSAYE